ncbi:class I SAM-dependent methyltransferase, partial [Pseudonocardia nigra]|uniref:class I SAM-dependent methyltransferase n=1 Tax=Pseudonocardia nigra TaxID=1921578 RepID=UPI001C5F8548
RAAPPARLRRTPAPFDGLRHVGPRYRSPKHEPQLKDDACETFDPVNLQRSNLAYRAPKLYDDLLANDAVSARIVSFAIDRRTPVSTVLDVGCGTGRDLGTIHARQRWHCTEVDLQPDLVEYARNSHPGCTFLAADIRNLRLNAAFDLILCLGNTLSYLHTDAELAATIATFAAHAASGSLVAISTLLGTGTNSAGRQHLMTTLGAAVTSHP